MNHSKRAVLVVLVWGLAMGLLVEFGFPVIYGWFF